MERTSACAAELTDAPTSDSTLAATDATDASAPTSDSISTNVPTIEDLRQRVTVELSEDLYAFNAYAFDVLCLPEKSSIELSSRVENILSKLSFNIAMALNADNSLVNTTFFHPVPMTTLNRNLSDEYLRKKFDFNPGHEIISSNGDKFAYIPFENYIRTRFPREVKTFELNTEYFKSPYFIKHIKPMSDDSANVVHILLYTDEFEVCNPIGVSRSKFKMFAVYFKILNFHARHTSNLQSLHLLMLVKSSTLKEVGMEELFSPMINELNKLYFDGIFVDGTKYYAIANVICGDNLANNFVGGFSLAFSNGFFCRFCKICSKDVVTKLNDTCFDERSHVEIVSDAFEKKNGMTCVSPFLNLPYVKMPLFFSPDIFHDLFEGISHLVLSTALLCLLKRKLTTLDIVNKILKDNSPFSVATVKLDHIQKGHLPFSGSQMMYWVQFFCAHFGCFFDFEDETWELVEHTAKL